MAYLISDEDDGISVVKLNDNVQDTIYCWIDGTWVYESDYDAECESIFGKYDFTIEVDEGIPTSKIHEQINKIIGKKR